MRKSIIILLWVVCASSGVAQTITVQNLTALPWTEGTATFPVGVSRCDWTATLSNNLFVGSGWQVESTNHYVVDVDGGGATLSMASERGIWGLFMAGFGLSMMAGLLGIGARWVRHIIGGSYNEDA